MYSMVAYYNSFDKLVNQYVDSVCTQDTKEQLDEELEAVKNVRICAEVLFGDVSELFLNGKSEGLFSRDWRTNEQLVPLLKEKAAVNDVATSELIEESYFDQLDQSEDEDDDFPFYYWDDWNDL